MAPNGHPYSDAAAWPGQMDSLAEPKTGRDYSSQRQTEPTDGSSIALGHCPSLDWTPVPQLPGMPNEILYNILGYLDVDDLLSTSRTNHHLRHLSLAPILHVYRLRHSRLVLPPLLTSRPPLADLISRSIFRTKTSVVSQQLGRSLVSIRLDRRLAARPSADDLVNRAVLLPECVPGKRSVHVAPALVAKRRAIEKEKVKDGLRHWVGAVWRGQVMQREEGMRKWERSRGVGRVWRLRQFWERVSKGDVVLDS